jgi:predicted permease
MGIIRRIWALGKREHLNSEIDEEMRDHMKRRIDSNIANGMTPDEATREARLRFGNPAVMKERVDAEDAAVGIDTLLRDTRYALRGFAKSPGFTVIAITTLALGIGANTAVFQLVDAVRLRNLPIQRPDELAEVRFEHTTPDFVWDGPYAHFTVPMWQEIRNHHEPFSGIFAWRPAGVTVGDRNNQKQVSAIELSGEAFSTLGIAPWQGRLIQPQDIGGCGPISKAVVSYAFWKAQMGGQPITPQTTIIAEGNAVQVLGVTPPSFFGLAVGDRFDLAYPTCDPPHPRREMFIFTVMGRLKPGWSLARASAYFASISPGIFEATTPTGYNAQVTKLYKSFKLGAYPAGAGVSMLRNAYNSSLQLLLAITGLVLLIACANLANLMLARASARQREMAIRMALGASRSRLLRQLLLESSLLALSGAVLGVALSQPLSRLLVASLSTSQGSIHLNIVTDWRVLLFAAAVAILTCIVFGTLPAMRGTRVDPISSLKSGERGIVGSRERFSVQRLMVITQIAVSLVLLVGALLFIHSYRNLATLNPGMRERGITIGYFGFQSLNIKPENEAEFKRQLVEDVRSVPGVENAASTNNAPLTGDSWSHNIRVDSREGSSKFTYASPTYFATMDIPLLSGRNFTDADTNNAPLVLIVNQTFIRQFLGKTQPIGQLIHVMPEPQFPERTFQIVGTIADTKYNDLRGDPVPIAFVPAAQLPITAQGPGMAMMIASSGGAADMNAIRRSIEAKHPQVDMQFSDFRQGIEDSLVGDRMMAMLSGFFGLLAAILVVVGLYGVLAFLITQRRNEIGIRIALGASRRRVIGLVMRDSAIMLVIGVVFGTALALLAGRAAGTLLSGLKSYDVATLVFAIGLLTAIAVIASLLPALKASRLNPVAALRCD